VRQSTKDMLTRVASIYRDAPDTGQHPVDEVAKRLGISYDAAKRRIYRARLAGLLEPARSLTYHSPSGDINRRRRMPETG